MQAFCDFDGTISKDDVTDLILERFALPQWRDIEEEWVEGHITSAECMRRQMALVRTTLRDLDELLDGVEIDPGFASFKSFCDANDIRLTIVSDGVDYFIKRLLTKRGMSGIEVIANTLIARCPRQDRPASLLRSRLPVHSAKPARVYASVPLWLGGVTTSM